MRIGWTLTALGLTSLLALSVPVGAGARPPGPSVSLPSLPSVYASPRRVTGAHVVVSQLESAPADARAGRAYVLRGTVVNEGSAAARGRVVVHLLRVGSAPLAVGRTARQPRGARLGGYRVRVRLPRALRDGLVRARRVRRRAGRKRSARMRDRASAICRSGARSARGALAASAARRAAAARPGAHSLSPFGAHVYPETGNGGYTSVHTDVFLNYDTESNLFLPGTHVVLTDQATQCLTDFSLDFERTSPNTKDGPDMTVGVGARERAAGELHVRPADLPRRPERPERSRPARARGRRAQPGRRPGRTTPSRPRARRSCLSPNPNKQFDLDGTQCPANKLVITPSSPIASGATVRRRGQLHRPAGRAQRRRRHDRGLVQGRPAGRHGQLRHDRAGRDRGLDAAERPPEREADLRLLRHRAARQDGDRERRARLAAGEPARRRTSPAARRPGTGTRRRGSRRTSSRTASARTT